MKNLYGYAIALLSTSAYAILYPMFKKGSEKIPPFTSMAISMFFLFVASLLLSIIFEHGLQFKFLSSKTGVQFLVLAGLINVIAFWLELVGFKYLAVWQLTLFTLLTPIIAGITAYFLLGEHVHPELFIGLAVMGIGMFIALK